MALRLGIGDTVTICKSAIDFCSKTLLDEHEDSRTMIAGMNLVRSHLQSLSKKVGDEKDFVASRPDIAPAIQRSLAPIHKDLSEMQQIIHEYHKRKPSLHIADQVCYHVLYKAKLATLRERMPAHRKSISEIGTLIEAQSHSERRASIARLGTLVEEHEEGRRIAGEAEDGRSELLQILEEDSNKEGVDTTDLLQRLEREIDKEGDGKEVNKHVRSIRNAMLDLDIAGQPGVQEPACLQLERFKF